MFSPKWDIHITPLTLKAPDLLRRGAGETPRVRGGWWHQGNSVCQTQLGSCTYKHMVVVIVGQMNTCWLWQLHIWIHGDCDSCTYEHVVTVTVTHMNMWLWQLHIWTQWLWQLHIWTHSDCDSYTYEHSDCDSIHKTWASCSQTRSQHGGGKCGHEIPPLSKKKESPLSMMMWQPHSRAGPTPKTNCATQTGLHGERKKEEISI